MVTESQLFLAVVASGYILALAVVIRSYLTKDKPKEEKPEPSEKEEKKKLGALSLSFFVAAALIFGWVCWLIWYDLTVWSKSLHLIFFGDRTGEAMSLGVGMRGIHYFLVGSAFLLSGFVLRRRTIELPRAPRNFQLLKYLPLVWLLPLVWCGYWGFLHDYLKWHKNIYQTIESQGYNMFYLFVSAIGMLLTHLLGSPRLPQAYVRARAIPVAATPKPVAPVATKNSKKGSFGAFALGLRIKKEKQK